MYSHILVTVAYEAAQDAAPSLDIAKALLAPGGQITLMHVMEPAPVFALSYLPEGWREDMRSAIEADMAKLAEGLDNAAIVVVEGDAAHEVLEHARAQRVACIIIASHRPGTQSLLLGSTASKVVARAQCAVHVARRPPAA
ncbi:universal stress protein [Roseinatronobacter monicus]|uniref:universal stress protein n=1 Tax=Roseinatronobacter monicus TaxID=393481 RepID=UPI003F371CD7